MELTLQILQVVSLVITTAIAALVVLAPVTKWEGDNKLLASLRWLHDLIARLLPTSTQLRK